MTLARGAAVGALVVAIVVVGVLLLGNKGGHEYHLIFQNAGQLVKDDDVQVGGRRIGSIRKIELTDDNQAEVTVNIDDSFGQLHQGTTAIIRATSLSGIANRYINLTPGPNNRPALKDGSFIPQDKTTTIVDLDQLFNTLDPKARHDLQQVIRGFSAQFAGKTAQANETAKFFNPALSTTATLVNELTRDQRAFTAFVVNSSRVMTALAARRSDLTDLVTNTNTTSAAIASENEALARALGLLPSTLRKANTTFVNLRSTLNDLDVLVAASKPATKNLAPFLRDLRPLVTAARPTIHDLQVAIQSPGPNNDLVDATLKLPKLEQVAKPAFSHSIQALRGSEPVLDFIRPYTPDLVGWFRDFGQGASAYDANGHYARIQPIFNAFSFSENPSGGVLTPIPPSQRMTGFQQPINKRCPGTSIQVPADKSAPFTDDGLDCDPSEVIPGP